MPALGNSHPDESPIPMSLKRRGAAQDVYRMELSKEKLSQVMAADPQVLSAIKCIGTATTAPKLSNNISLHSISEHEAF
jgi:hypothetical protein